MKKNWTQIIENVLLGAIGMVILAILVMVGFVIYRTGGEPERFAEPQVTEARFLFPPLCQKRSWENATVCIAWDPYLHEFTEVKRVPLNPAGPLPGAAALRPVGPRS